MTVQTTDGQPVSKDVTKDDAKAMADAYVKGATIDDLAAEYGYTPLEVSQVVVKEPADTTTVLQSDESQKPETTKKGK